MFCNPPLEVSRNTYVEGGIVFVGEDVYCSLGGHEGCGRGIPDQVRNEENESGMRGIGGISLYSLGL